MARNKTNIKMQLNKRIDDLLRIGEKKVKETCDTPHFNPNRSEGIHSIKTAETYRQVINTFAEYCKTKGIKDVAQIDSNIIGSFVGTRSNLSPWTLSKDLAAINKVMDTHYTPKDFGICERSRDQIVNNRRTIPITARQARSATKQLFGLLIRQVAEDLQS